MIQPNLIETVFKLMHTFRTEFSSALESAGVSVAPMHLKILRIISVKKECTAQHIAKIVDRDKAQITRVIQELVSKDLIKRILNPNDKRSQFLSLSTAGHNTLEQMLIIEKRVLEQMVTGIDIQDQDTFLTLVKRLNNNLVSIDPSNNKCFPDK